ncbi:MAG: histidine kinase [Acidimicrobiia bacterium]|nr:histidine kinase [Acidimicrobiia bacterium]
MASQTFEQMVPANRERIGVARADLRAWLMQHAMDPDRIIDVLLVVSEALTNAAEHGHGFDESAIELHATWTADELMVMVSDTGVWGLPHTMADRGRGVGIIRALADEASIDNTHRGTTVRVTFNLGQVPPSAPETRPVEVAQMAPAARPALSGMSPLESLFVDPSGGLEFDGGTDAAGWAVNRRSREVAGVGASGPPVRLAPRTMVPLRALIDLAVRGAAVLETLSSSTRDPLATEPV